MPNKILMLLFSFLLAIPVGAGAQGKPDSVDAEGHQWWQHAVFYELYPRSFADRIISGRPTRHCSVGETAWIKFVEDRMLPPLMTFCVDRVWFTLSARANRDRQQEGK